MGVGVGVELALCEALELDPLLDDLDPGKVQPVTNTTKRDEMTQVLAPIRFFIRFSLISRTRPLTFNNVIEFI